MIVFSICTSFFPGNSDDFRIFHHHFLPSERNRMKPDNVKNTKDIQINTQIKVLTRMYFS